MIWSICFISLSHFFEIHIFSSHINHSIGHQYKYLTWADPSHNRLRIEPNTTSIYIEKCNRKLEYLIATCSLINKYYHPLYKCQPKHLRKRLKRSNADQPKHSTYTVLSLGIGIPCFLIGTILGTVVAIVISIKRQKRLNELNRTYDPSNQIDSQLRPLGVTRGLTNSPAFNAVTDPISIQRDRGIITRSSLSK